MTKNVVWAALAVLLVILVGVVVVSLLGTIIKLVFYFAVGAAVVWGAFYLWGKIKRSS